MWWRLSSADDGADECGVCGPDECGCADMKGDCVMTWTTVLGASVTMTTVCV